MASTNDYAVDMMNDNAVEQAVDEARKKNRKKNRIIEITLYSLSFIFLFIFVLKYPFSGKVMLEEEEKKVKTATTFRDAARVELVQSDQRNASMLRDYKENKITLDTIKEQVASVVAELEKIFAASGDNSETTSLDALPTLSRQSSALRTLFIREQENRKKESGILPPSVSDNKEKNKIVVFTLIGDDDVYQNGFVYSYHWISAVPSFQPKAMLRNVRTTNDYELILDTPFISNVVNNPKISCYTSRMISFGNFGNVLFDGISETQTENIITQDMLVYCLYYSIKPDGTDELKETRGFVSENYESDGQIFHSTSISYEPSMRGAPVFNVADQLVGMIIDASVNEQRQAAFIPVDSIKFK
ncbi:MAG: hypothetical protein ABIH86_06325 [Planctomycetota bacterium]